MSMANVKRDVLASTFTYRELADEFEVTHATICAWLNGQRPCPLWVRVKLFYLLHVLACSHVEAINYFDIAELDMMGYAVHSRNLSQLSV